MVKRNAANNGDFINRNSNNIPLSNKFRALSAEENFDSFNKRVYDDDVNVITNSYVQKKQATVGLNAGTSVRGKNEQNSENKRRPQVVTKNITEKTIHPRTVPGNSSYADLTTSGKKVCMFGASILQRINIKEFNKELKDKTAIKECYPGATASKTAHHMKPTLDEEKPDIVIINIGTNNLTKKKWQTEEDIVKEIIQVVNDCKQNGVNEIYVSGLTVRRGFYHRIKAINELLQKKSGTYSYSFIDNSNIRDHHLRNDGLHLEYEGTCILANNFIDALNYVSILTLFIDTRMIPYILPFYLTPHPPAMILV